MNAKNKETATEPARCCANGNFGELHDCWKSAEPVIAPQPMPLDHVRDATEVMRNDEKVAPQPLDETGAPPLPPEQPGDRTITGMRQWQPMPEPPCIICGLPEFPSHSAAATKRPQWHKYQAAPQGVGKLSPEHSWIQCERATDKPLIGECLSCNERFYFEDEVPPKFCQWCGASFEARDKVADFVDGIRGENSPLPEVSETERAEHEAHKAKHLPRCICGKPSDECKATCGQGGSMREALTRIVEWVELPEGRCLEEDRAFLINTAYRLAKATIANPKGVEGVGQTARELLVREHLSKNFKPELLDEWPPLPRIVAELLERETLTLRAELQQVKRELQVATQNLRNFHHEDCD